MNHWKTRVTALALLLVFFLFIILLPLTTHAAPGGGVPGTPFFLPLVRKNAPITVTVPITVAPVVSSVEQFVFSPATVTIHAGDTVHWVWSATGHTVTSGPAGTPDNQFCSPNDTSCATIVTSSQGDTFDHQFLAPGTYTYFCQIHWSLFGMTGTVVVLP